MKIPVDASIAQVIDGSHYKGHLKIAGTKFDFSLIFAYPIPRLNYMSISGETGELRKLIKISVKRDKNKIELEDKEYDMFFAMIMYLALTFYDDPATRADQRGFKGAMIRGEGTLGALGLRLRIGLRSKGWYDLPQELCQILTGPKFGCVLA